MDQATFVSWHDFYVTMGTASASLIGLLFVALSLNLDVITGESRDDLRAFAEQAFNSFSSVLLIAVFFLIPEHSPATLGDLYLLLGSSLATGCCGAHRQSGGAGTGIGSERRRSGGSCCLRPRCSDSWPPGSVSCAASPTRCTGS
jgi:hypothetical protein